MLRVPRVIGWKPLVQRLGHASRAAGCSSRPHTVPTVGSDRNTAIVRYHGVRPENGRMMAFLAAPGHGSGSESW